MRDHSAAKADCASPQTYRLRLRCPSCRVYLERSPLAPLPRGFTCRRCETGIPLASPGIVDERLDSCVVCSGRYFYLEKDFPKPLRFFFMGLAILLSFFTYGLSLIFFAALDWLLFQNLPWMRICYSCEGEYRGFPHNPLDPHLKPFDPHKGVAYDARREVPPTYVPVPRISE